MLSRTKTHVRREKSSEKSINGQWCPLSAICRLKTHRFRHIFHCPQYSDLSDKKSLTCETVPLSVKPRLLLLLGAGGGWQLWQSETGEGLRADYRTAKGAVSRQQLEDGSLLTLNTQSAADVRFDAHQRTVRLWYGEIAITTAKDAQQRPFRVLTRQGQLTALGTEFTVRQQDNFTQLDVQQHAVEVLLASAPAQKRIVNAGESLQFSASEFGAVKPLDDESTSWTKGILSFSDKPLGEVIATLSRYRNGVLRCDPAVAGLRLSGTFPLKNTDAILNVIAQTLPVKIQSITRYWINISPL